MMGVKAIVDTSVLLRSIFTDMDHHAEVDALVKRVVLEDTELWISGQIIREFIVQATHPRTLSQPLTIAEVVAEIEKMKSVYQIADETSTVRDTLLDLLQAYPTGGKQVHDANVVATMIAYGLDTLLTLNVADFKRFGDKITILTIDGTSDD